MKLRAGRMQVNILLTPVDRDWLKQTAELQGVSMGEIVEAMIFLRRHSVILPNPVEPEKKWIYSMFGDR